MKPLILAIVFFVGYWAGSVVYSKKIKSLAGVIEERAKAWTELWNKYNSLMSYLCQIRAHQEEDIVAVPSKSVSYIIREVTGLDVAISKVPFSEVCKDGPFRFQGEIYFKASEKCALPFGEVDDRVGLKFDPETLVEVVSG